MSILQEKHQQWPAANLDTQMFYHQQPLWKQSCCSANGETPLHPRIISSLRIWALSALTSPVDGSAAPEQ